ncbi:MAG: flippase-like domain-containing protein [Acidobacteria bacterium]|nr:flippase-like domain-containing protein [Acidobacteriota bacterium]
MKKIVFQLVKFGLAAAVVIYLVLRGDIAWEPLRASMAEWQYTVPAFLLLALTPVGQFWRWQSLLRCGGLRLPGRDVFSFVMVSKFFSMAMPGYISGDILRGFYVFRRTTGQGETDAASEKGNSCSPNTAPPTVVASIVFDRAAGLFPLFVMSLLGLLGAIWYPLPSGLDLSIGLLAGAGVSGMLILFLLAWWTDRAPRWLVRAAGIFGAGRAIEQLFVIAHSYVRNLNLIANIIGVSFLTQGAGLLSFILFGFALRVEIPLSLYFMLVPVGLMVTAIPITPAGLGVGQVAFLTLFHMAGSGQGANLYTLYAVSYVLINSSGAFLYLSSRFSNPLPEQANAVKINRP